MLTKRKVYKIYNNKNELENINKKKIAEHLISLTKYLLIWFFHVHINNNLSYLIYFV